MRSDGLPWSPGGFIVFKTQKSKLLFPSDGRVSLLRFKNAAVAIRSAEASRAYLGKRAYFLLKKLMMAQIMFMPIAGAPTPNISAKITPHEPMWKNPEKNHEKNTQLKVNTGSTLTKQTPAINHSSGPISTQTGGSGDSSFGCEPSASGKPLISRILSSTALFLDGESCNPLSAGADPSLVEIVSTTGGLHAA